VMRFLCNAEFQDLEKNLARPSNTRARWASRMISKERSQTANPRTQRATCLLCRRPEIACYCAELKPFDPGFDLGILVHPREHRNPVGTARMLHRHTRGSRVFVGTGGELDRDAEFLKWLDSRTEHARVLYPDAQAEWLTGSARTDQGPPLTRACILLIDGTWSQAKGLMRQSGVLQSLPRVAFQPARPSQYGFREQPAELCLSSLEAVHELCILMDTVPQDQLQPMKDAFLRMVDFQLKSESKNRAFVQG